MEPLETVVYRRVADMERSLTFYRDGLGLAVTTEMKDHGGSFYARLESGGFVVMISNRPSRFVDFIAGTSHPLDHDHDSEEHSHDPGAFHGVASVHDGQLNLVTYVYVADADATFEELKGRGIEPLDAPSDKFYGLREFLIMDPDGYYYAFGSRLD